MTHEIDPFRQAYQEMPERWYEGMSIPKRVTIGGSIIISNIVADGIFDGYHELLTRYPVVTSLIGAFIYSISVIADNRSTVKTLNTIEEASKVGVKVIWNESYPGLSSQPSIEEYKTSKFRKTMDIIATIASGATPLLAPGLAITRGVAAAGNTRIEKRLQRAMQIAQTTK